MTDEERVESLLKQIEKLNAKVDQTEGTIVELAIPADGIRIERPYLTKSQIRRYYARYDKWVIVPPHFPSDGATKAIDIKGSVGWLVHDYLTVTGVFADGTKCTNWQASRVLTDQLAIDGYTFRRWTWFWPTWLFGGGKCRQNGMW